MKKYDIVAKVGEYTKNGETKARYLNVGALMEKDGRPFILLNRAFNPAALDAGKENVLLSLYEPKNRSQEQHTQAKGNAFVEELSDDLPF